MNVSPTQDICSLLRVFQEVLAGGTASAHPVQTRPLAVLEQSREATSIPSKPVAQGDGCQMSPRPDRGPGFIRQPRTNQGRLWLCHPRAQPTCRPKCCDHRGRRGPAHPQEQQRHGRWFAGLLRGQFGVAPEVVAGRSLFWFQQLRGSPSGDQRTKLVSPPSQGGWGLLQAEARAGAQGGDGGRESHSPGAGV